MKFHIYMYKCMYVFADNKHTFACVCVCFISISRKTKSILNDKAPTFSEQCYRQQGQRE